MENIMKDSKELYVTIEDVTPEKAREMLATMDKNRKLRSVKVAEYARAMSKDAFYSITPIVFDVNGHLVDGQHRLQAVIESGKTVRFVIEYNSPEGTIFDNGMKRSAADSLYMSGLLPNELSLSDYQAIVNAYALCKAPDHRKILSIEEKGQFISDHAETLAKARDYCLKGKAHPTCKRASIVAAVFAALECGVDESIIANFCEVANSEMPNSPSEFAAAVLGKQVRDQRRAGDAMNARITSWTEQAIIDFVNGKPRRKSYSKIIHPFIDKCPATI